MALSGGDQTPVQSLFQLSLNATRTVGPSQFSLVDDAGDATSHHRSQERPDKHENVALASYTLAHTMTFEQSFFHVWQTQQGGPWKTAGPSVGRGSRTTMS